MTAIAANTVLPARRHRLEFTAADGTPLVGELALPERTAPRATLLCVHPLTTHGGSMQSHLFRKMSWRLPALAGLGVLRFNLRGAGEGADASGGSFDAGRGEGLDLAAAITTAVAADLPDLWLVGWSFGTDVILAHGDRDPVRGAVLLSPPLRFTTSEQLARWAGSPRPLTALVPGLDDYLRPDDARRRFAVVPHADVRGVDGASHLWVGERWVRVVLNEVVGIVAPAAVPLPTEWVGPSTRWSDLP